MVPPKDEELKAVVLGALRTSMIRSGDFEDITDTIDLDDLGLAFRPDLILREGDTTFIVEVRQRLSISDVARAYLYMHLIEADKLIPRKVRYILMGKTIPGDLNKIALRTGVVDLFQLDWSTHLPRKRGKHEAGVSKLSHEKSWWVVTALLRMGPTSIRKLSLETGVSYGWTHATVVRLMDMDVAERTGQGYSIMDDKKLLNGIAWERPLSSLSVEGFSISGEDLMRTARELENTFYNWEFRHAFTGPTAGGIYTGYAQRFDRIYLYLSDMELTSLRRSLEDPDGTITLEVLQPDREVFKESRIESGVTLVSPEQALLDLAGLGYSAMDLTIKMARYHEEKNQR